MRNDMQTYRVLLNQFAKLPVFKIVVCRVTPERWASAEQQQKQFERIKAWVTEVLDKGGMASAEQVYIREDETVTSQYFELRSLVTDMPWTPIGDWSIKTSGELKETAERMINHKTRTKELQKKTRSLERQRETLNASINKLRGKVANSGKKKGWGLAVAAATAVTGVGLPMAVGAGGAFWAYHANQKRRFLNQVAKYEKWKAFVEQEIASIARELASGVTNRMALEDEKKVLQDLERLARRP